MSDKTEEPTPRRLRKAREQGDVAVSGALSQAAAFTGTLLLVPAALGAAVGVFSELLHAALAGEAGSPAALGLAVLAVTLPMVAAGAAAAVAVGLLQSGGLLVPGRVAPRLERLDPAAGLSGLVSAARLVGVLRALLAALLVSWLVIRSLRAAAPGLAHGVGELAAVSALAGDVALELGGYAALLGLSLGALDLWVVRRAWLRRFRMSKDEVRREYRESEGDPELKAARRRAHREVLVSQQLHAVKSASVVIVNPTHLATALRYDQEQEGAPEVVAQGQGDVARRILDAARAYGVPVIRNVPLARALQELEVGSEIPELLYEAVAEVLREVWESR